MVARARMTGFRAGSPPSAGLGSTATPRSGSGRSMISRASGRRSGTSSTCGAGRRTSGCSAGARCPGAEWFPGARLNYAEHVFRGKPDDRVAILHASELRELDELTWGELRARTARDRRRPACGWASAAATASRPTCRTSRRRSPRSSPCASIGAIWSSCPPDFGARSRHRPLRADRAEGAARRRRLPLQRPRLRPRATSSPSCSARSPSLEHTVVLPYLGPSRPGRLASRWPGRAGRRARRELAFEPRAVRPPAVGPLLLGHDRAAQGDRARPGRDPARAPEEAPPARRRASEGDRFFWFTTTGWMMWNFLVGVLLTDAAIVLYDGNPGHPRHGRAVGPRRADRMTLLRHERRLHRRVHEGGRRAGRAGATWARCARSARPARRCPRRASTGSTSTSARDTWLFST